MRAVGACSREPCKLSLRCCAFTTSSLPACSWVRWLCAVRVAFCSGVTTVYVKVQSWAADCLWLLEKESPC